MISSDGFTNLVITKPDFFLATIAIACFDLFKRDLFLKSKYLKNAKITINFYRKSRKISRKKMHNSGFVKTRFVNPSHEQIINFLIFFSWYYKYLYDFRISFATLWLRASYCKVRLINISPTLALGIYDQFTIMGWVDKTWLNLKQSYRIMKAHFLKDTCYF